MVCGRDLPPPPPPPPLYLVLEERYALWGEPAWTSMALLHTIACRHLEEVHTHFLPANTTRINTTITCNDSTVLYNFQCSVYAHDNHWINNTCKNRKACQLSCMHAGECTMANQEIIIESTHCMGLAQAHSNPCWDGSRGLFYRSKSLKSPFAK